MNLIVANEIPRPRSRKNYEQIYRALEEFSKMDADIVKIDAIKEGYKKAMYCAKGFTYAVKRYGFRVRVFQRGTFVYLEKIPTEEA